VSASAVSIAARRARQAQFGAECENVTVSRERVKVVVSACLLGAPVRYNGTDKKSSHPVLQRWIDEGRIVSVCPEVLGGLGTPRPPAEIVRVGDVRRVRTNGGRDVTAEFESGAAESLRQAFRAGARVAVLKETSPSCGSAYVYDGTFTGTRVAGEGVTAATLRANGIKVFSEIELNEAAAYITALEAEDT
jgi:uncharacterized protein YbbK (DUF523 family)